MLSWTIRRRRLVQRCPAVPTALKTTARTARSRSALGRHDHARCCLPARAADGPSRSAMIGASALPMVVEPVAEISGRRGSAASWRARPAAPTTTSSRPSGASPKRAAARRNSAWQARAVSGVRSLGFQTTGSPHTSASAAFQLQTATGKLNALMTPIGPSGCQVSSMRCPGRSETIVRPNSWRERPTARSQMSIISCTSPRPSCAILPVSSVTSAPSASFSARSSSPSRRTSSPRRGAGTSRQASKALHARAIAASVPTSSVRCSRAICSPVMGVRTGRSPSLRADRSSSRRLKMSSITCIGKPPSGRRRRRRAT